MEHFPFTIGVQWAQDQCLSRQFIFCAQLHEYINLEKVFCIGPSLYSDAKSLFCGSSKHSAVTFSGQRNIQQNSWIVPSASERVHKLHKLIILWVSRLISQEFVSKCTKENWWHYLWSTLLLLTWGRDIF